MREYPDLTQEFAIISELVGDSLDNLTKVHAALKKLHLTEKKSAKELLLLFSEAGTQFSDTATLLQEVARENAEQRSRFADQLLNSIIVPWESFIKESQKKKKDLENKHQKTVKSLSPLRSSLDNYREECLKLFNGLNTHLAKRKMKEEEGKEQKKKASYFEKLNRPVQQIQQRGIKVFTQFEEKLEAANQYENESRQQRKQMCEILHSAYDIERQALLIFQMNIDGIVQSQQEILRSSVQPVMSRDVPNTQALIDANVSSLIVHPYDTPCLARDLLSHSNETQIHQVPLLQPALDELSPWERKEAEERDKLRGLSTASTISSNSDDDRKSSSSVASASSVSSSHSDSSSGSRRNGPMSPEIVARSYTAGLSDLSAQLAKSVQNPDLRPPTIPDMTRSGSLKNKKTKPLKKPLPPKPTNAHPRAKKNSTSIPNLPARPPPSLPDRPPPKLSGSSSSLSPPASPKFGPLSRSVPPSKSPLESTDSMRRRAPATSNKPSSGQFRLPMITTRSQPALRTQPPRTQPPRTHPSMPRTQSSRTAPSPIRTPLPKPSRAAPRSPTRSGSLSQIRQGSRGLPPPHGVPHRTAVGLARNLRMPLKIPNRSKTTPPSTK